MNQLQAIAMNEGLRRTRARPHGDVCAFLQFRLCFFLVSSFCLDRADAFIDGY